MDGRAESRTARLETVDGELYVRIEREGEPEYQKVIKGWESYGGKYWFALELDRTQDSVVGPDEVVEDDPIYFGFVQGQECELGYFAGSQLDHGMIWEINEVDLPHAGRRPRNEKRAS